MGNPAVDVFHDRVGRGAVECTGISRYPGVGTRLERRRIIGGYHHGSGRVRDTGVSRSTVGVLVSATGGTARMVEDQRSQPARTPSYLRPCPRVISRNRSGSTKNINCQPPDDQFSDDRRRPPPSTAVTARGIGEDVHVDRGRGRIRSRHREMLPAPPHSVHPTPRSTGPAAAEPSAPPRCPVHSVTQTVPQSR